MITKCNLECDVGGNGFVLISEVIDFEALSDLCPHMIVDLHEVGQIFGNLGR